MIKKSIFDIFPSIIKDFIIVYRVALLGIILAGTLLISSSLNQKKKEVEMIVTSASDSIKKNVTYDIDYVKYQTFYASSQIANMNGDSNKIYKLLSTFLTNINSQVDVALTWNAFSWIDNKNFLAIDATSGVLNVPVDVSHRDYLKETPKQFKKIIFGKPIYGALSHRYIMPSGLGVFSSTGKYLGTLVFGFDIEKIVTKLEKNLNNSQISFAFYKDGEYIFSSQNFNNEYLEIVKDKVLELSKNERIDRKMISSQKVLSKKGIIANFQKIKGQPLQFVTFYNQNTYHNQVLDIIFKQIVIIFIILFSCIILFRSIYKKIVKPVSKLSKLARKISEHDFSYEAEEPESKELKDLFGALNMLKESFQREENLVTQLKSANQIIAQENFNKSEFLSAISHDIRNPLTAIISLTQMLQNKESDDAEESVREIELCANDALQFINDLMDVTQASSGIFSINMEQKININDMIKRSIRVNRDFANKKNITIINNCQTDLNPINLDQRRVKQILINLINNAIKYSRQNTRVEISAQIFTQNDKRKLMIEIKDEGLGMSSEQLDKAMTKFGLSRENEKKGNIDSFGLGLNLVKQLVELQNGIIEIKSRAGIGTIATIVFTY